MGRGILNTIAASLCVALTLILLSCEGANNPEHQIREMIAAGEEAVEARSIMSARDFIANSYQDQQGRQKAGVEKILAGYILRNKSIHLLTRVHDLTLNDNQIRADIILYVAMANIPLPTLDQLVYTRADFYRFDLELLLEEGEWRISSGRWHPARLEEFGL